MRSSLSRLVVVLAMLGAIAMPSAADEAAAWLDGSAYAIAWREPLSPLERATARQSQSGILIGLGLIELALYGRRHRTAGL